MYYVLHLSLYLHATKVDKEDSPAPLAAFNDNVLGLHISVNHSRP
jgi:hypothetical protein